LVKIAKEYGWRDKEFKSIIDEALSPEKDVLITDISSPPGTSKTRNTLKYAVERRKPLIASFPTHTNQEQALEYIVSHLEEEKPKKLPFFVLDYAGIENYCIFYRPEVLMKFLDKFREEGQTYTDAVDNFLGQPVITAILVQRGLNIDDIWYEIGEALDEYKKTGDKKKYIAKIREIVEKKGQYEICRGVCPIGLMFWQYRRNVYHDLSEPKIITWRKEKAKELRKKYPETGKHIIVANPDNCIENFEKLLSGKYNIQHVLCPRLLLISKVSLTNKKPNYIAVRRSIILTPHAGLQFVLSVVRREHEIQGLTPKHLLFLDEYDALLKPKIWKVYSLSALASLQAIAEMIISKGIGSTINGIYIDDYLYRYAEYVRTISKRVREIVEEAINTKKYHPLVNLFIEGALSKFEETTLKVNLAMSGLSKLEYESLSPRPVHIKYFLGDDLLPLILNEKIFFSDLASGDPEWRINLRIAKINFSKLASNVPVYEYYPLYIKTVNGKMMLLRRRKRRRNIHRIIADLREYLRPLLIYPRYAVFYRINENNQIELTSIDVKIYTLLQLKGILTSASPVLWDYIVNGPRQRFTASMYVNMVQDSLLSTIWISISGREEYFDKMITKYEVSFNAYANRNDIEQSVSTGAPLPKTIKLKNIKGIIKQISVLSTMSQEYSRLLQVYYVRVLPPLYIPPPTVKIDERRLVRERIFDSLKPYLRMLSYYGKRDNNRYALLLVQNKRYATILARILDAKLCHKEKCGDKIKNPTHFSNPNRKIDITWFRSRAERGIDLPHEYSLVIVVGSPYPKPGYIGGDNIEPSDYTTSIAQMSQFLVMSYNTKTKRKVSIAHIPYDILSGISELTQAIGRATRSVMRTGEPVKVIIPTFLRRKIHIYAPLWLKVEGPR
jgi:hypothetical protein